MDILFCIPSLYPVPSFLPSRLLISLHFTVSYFVVRWFFIIFPPPQTLHAVIVDKSTRPSPRSHCVTGPPTRTTVCWRDPAHHMPRSAQPSGEALESRNTYAASPGRSTRTTICKRVPLFPRPRGKARTLPTRSCVPAGAWAWVRVCGAVTLRAVHRRPFSVNPWTRTPWTASHSACTQHARLECLDRPPAIQPSLNTLLWKQVRILCVFRSCSSTPRETNYIFFLLFFSFCFKSVYD